MSWDDVTATDTYQGLPDNQKVQAANQYFDQKVASQIPQEHLPEAKNQFLKQKVEGYVAPDDYAGQANKNIGSTLGGAAKDIGSDTLEALHDTAKQTGEAISEPINGPNVPTWMKPIDAVVRGVGKLGNAIGGVYGAATSPIKGALGASVENSGIIPATAQAVKENIVPNDTRFSANIPQDKQHEVAMNTGGDLANAVMLGKGAEQGELNRAQQSLDTAQHPTVKAMAEQNLQDVKDKYNVTTPKPSAPTKGLLSDTGSGNQQPTLNSEGIQSLKDAGTNSYEEAKTSGGILHKDSWGKMVDDAVDATVNKDNGGLATKTIANKSGISDIIEKLQDTKGSHTTLADAQQIDDDLGNHINSAIRSGDMDTVKRLMDMRASLRTSYKDAAAEDMENGSGFAAWQKGDKIWTAYRAAKDVQDIIENGKRAEVPSTAIKNGFKTFINNMTLFNG